jgi:hypothetical protein
MRAVGTLLFAALLVCFTACADASVDFDPKGPLPDDGDAVAPAAPLVDDLEPSPYSLVALRGSAFGASRVIVTGDGRSYVRSLLPSGGFCVDVPFAEPGTYTFQVYAQSDTGLVSRMASTVTVTYDPSAPEPDGSALCDGSDPALCTDDPDACVPPVPDCAPDILEPNDDETAPRIEPARYANLRACSSNADFYPVLAERGSTVRIQTQFRHSDGDLDLRLYDVDFETSLAYSISVDDDEELSVYIPEDGLYLAKVYVLGTDKIVPYTLTIERTGP